ncbi:MAG: short-chain dehydrogenase [Bacteroidetes bacterium RIFCSPLOWO2_02_FULL_36_8]|nr:MAG: short-chain dehydrogenase [Bacteroidetes bacterium RIFCSPLOWO2_02_FULL_36_8]OFY71381.1 MAG: short-chain dehydrogenase [Bacteroidetes bacterium RIFCSPLOWO2_12_FULL_37_12]
MNLKNKTAIVTGVSRGIGRSIVDVLLQKGAKVTGWGRKDPKIENKNFLFVKMDIRFPEQVKKGLAKTSKFFGGTFDILINNSGLGYFGKIDEMSDTQWYEMFDTNVHGIFYCCRNIVPLMKKNNKGHIVNISSIAGKIGMEEGAGYCGTKFAVRGISEALFKELRKYGIKVTCIFPGSVNTSFFDNIQSVTANELMLTPQEVAKCVLDVLEADKNSHVTEVELRPFNVKGKM